MPRNASTIEFRDKFCVHKRRFATNLPLMPNLPNGPWSFVVHRQVTTHKNYYTGERPDMRSNPGMIADSTRLKKRLQEM